MLRLAYFIELTWLLFDMLSGYLQNHGVVLFGGLSISALVRIFVVFLFSAITVRYSKSMRLPTLILAFLCVIWIIGHAITTVLGESNNVIEDVQFHMKLLLPVLLFIVFQVQMEYYILDAKKIRRIVLFNGAILICNLWLGLFGIGFGNYGETENGELIGSKGFFYAGNEVSPTLVAIFALLLFLYRDRLRRNLFLMAMLGAIFFFSSLMSLSKTSLLGFLMVMLFAFHNYLTPTKKMRLSVISAVTVLTTSPFWLALLVPAIERWQYFWERRTDFLEFITSGRTGRIEQYVSWMASAETPLPLIFGIGQGNGHANFENDLLDLTMRSGVLGLLFYAIWSSWGVAGITAWVRYRRKESVFTVYMIGMFLVVSIMAGHVMSSATLAPFIALLALTSSRVFPDNEVPQTNIPRVIALGADHA